MLTQLPQIEATSWGYKNLYLFVEWDHELMKWFLKKTNTHIDTKIRHILKAEDLCWMGFPIPHYGVKGRQNYAFYLYTLKIFFHSRREIKERLNNHSAEVATETHPWTRNGIREERSGSRTDLNQRCLPASTDLANTLFRHIHLPFAVVKDFPSS